MKYIGFISLLFLPSLVLSQGSSRGAASLKLPMTPFVGATAEAFVADPASLQSILVNPANIASCESYDILFSHTEWIQDIQTEYLSVGVPLHAGTLSLAIGNTGVNDIQIHGNGPGPALGTFNSQSTFFQLTYGAELTNSIRCGISTKYLYDKIFIDDAAGYGVDVGILYIPPMDGLTLGTSLTNLGKLSAFRSEPSDLPSQIRLGGTYSFAFSDISFKTAAAFSSELGLSISHLSLGIEATYNNTLTALIGYHTGFYTRGISAGIGIRYSIVAINYAYVPFSQGFGNAHVISIGFFI